MGLNLSNDAERAEAIKRLRSLRKAYRTPARDAGRRQWYISVVEALECALLALGDTPDKWGTK